MRDNQNYLSNYMLYNINVTIVLQIISQIHLKNNQAVLARMQEVALHEV